MIITVTLGIVMVIIQIKQNHSSDNILSQKAHRHTAVHIQRIARGF
jgi:hypothetical protein